MESGRSSSTLPSRDSSDPHPLEEDVVLLLEDRQSEKPPKHPSSTLSKPSSETSGKRKKYSAVWDHFVQVTGTDFAKCNYCDALIGCASRNGTTPLKNHTKRCKRLPSNLDKKQKMLDLETRTVVGANGVVGTISVPCCWVFDQDVCRKAIARMILLDELPFAIFEHEGFRYFCKCLNPEFVVPSRCTVARDCYKLYFEDRKDLKESFKKLSCRISLTTDAWTSSQNLSYMCLTSHFIDDDWVLHKRILNFCPLAGHSGQLIGRAVEKCLADWDIQNIMIVTVDNASSNDLAIEHLRRIFNHRETSILEGKFLHMRCHCHILNLVVKDGLKEIDSCVLRVRGLVRYVRSSPARMDRFKKCVEEEKLESKSLVCLDVETRWNSTFLMLQSALKFKKAFSNLILKDSTCVKENKKIGLPNEEDWRKVSSILAILKVFYDATLLLSGSRYVTSNLAAEDVFGVGRMINNYCMREHGEHTTMAIKMKAKYDKYWGNVLNINLYMFVVVFLDPRRKLKYVNFLVRKLFNESKANILTLHISDTITELFGIYASSMPQVSKDSESCTPCLSSSTLNECDQGDVMDFATLLSAEYQTELGGDCIENKTELDKYLEDACETVSPSFRILSWWKENQKRYLVLAKMARDILAIPVSTVASESAFSTGGRVLDSFRTSLSPNMVEALIRSQDWQRKSNTSIAIEETLAGLEKIEAGLKELYMEHPDYHIDEVVNESLDNSTITTL